MNKVICGHNLNLEIWNLYQFCPTWLFVVPFEKEKVVQVYFAETGRKQPSFYTVSVIFLKATWLIKYEDGTKRNMVFRLHPQIFSGISNFHFEHVFVYKGQKKLFSDVVKHILLKNIHIC